MTTARHTTLLVHHPGDVEVELVDGMAVSVTPRVLDERARFAYRWGSATRSRSPSTRRPAGRYRLRST